MSDTTPAGAANAPAVPVSGQPSPRNPSVVRCVQAYNIAMSTTLAKKYANQFEAQCKAHSAAHDAYRTAMPHLHNLDTARDFIACVAQGVMLNVFSRQDAGGLLYAAQIAINAQPRDRRPVGRPTNAASSTSVQHLPTPAQAPETTPADGANPSAEAIPVPPALGAAQSACLLEN